MQLGKAPKMSFSTRRIRLGVSHHGSPSRWTAPVKDVAPVERVAKVQKKRR